jgi:hypothetical protein
VNACDGSEQNILVYASPTSTTLSVGQTVGVTINSTCYSVISYEGIVINEYVIPGFTPVISQTFTNCEVCLSSSIQTNNGGEVFFQDSLSNDTFLFD